MQVAIVVYPARPILRKQPDHGRIAWAAIDPYRQGRCCRVLVASLEEPEEQMLVLGNIDIAALL